MGRENMEANRIRNPLFSSAFGDVLEALTLAGNISITQDMPRIIALDAVASSRNVTMYTPDVTAFARSHEIINISSGAGILVVKSPAAATIGTLNKGERALVQYINSTQGWKVYKILAADAAQSVAAMSTLSLYTTLAGIANTNVLAVNVPFAFTLNAVRFRPKAPATTAAKAATLTAGIASTGTGALTNCTGGVISLTSATMTPTNTPLAGTAITALNTGAAGSAVGVTASSVTAFAEGDGYLEMDLINTSILV